jgi:hypothetical protein
MPRSRIAQVSSLLLLSAAAACDRQAPAPPPPAAAPAATPPPPPAKPAAPEYSPAKAAELLKELEGCQYDFSCPAYKPVVSFGNKVSKDLLAIALDATKKGHKVAAQALGEIKDPSVGLPLFQAALKTKDFMMRGDLGTAAGKSGGDELFNAATKLYSEKLTSDQSDLIERAIAPSGDKAIDWAVGKLPSAKKVIPACALADVIRKAAEGKPDALPKIQTAISKTKQPMARHRLASVAIALGDVQQFDVLAAGLKDPKDDLNRSDAGNMLRDVVGKLPAARKDEFIKLLEAAQKKSRGGLETAGIESSLASLKKT